MNFRTVYLGTLVVFLIVSVHKLTAQIDAYSVMGVPSGLFSEIDAISDANEGALAYASDANDLVMYNGSKWSTLAQRSDVHAFCGFFVVSGLGTISITDLPFSPTSIAFVAHANVEDIDLDSDNGVNDNNTGIANAFGTSNGFARNNAGAILQQSIYVGGSGNSINDISRFASSAHCVGIRYGDRNGNPLGLTTLTVSTFGPNGFDLNVDNYTDGLVVLFTAYR